MLRRRLLVVASWLYLGLMVMVAFALLVSSTGGGAG
jgi:hypothetical protein